MNKLIQKITVLSLGLLTATFYASLSFAQDNAEQAAYRQAKKYAEMVACGTNFSDDNNPVKFFPIGTDKNELRYAVLWQGDVGCLGGTGTSYYVLSVFKYASLAKTFLLAQDDVFGEINKNDFTINSRFIESIKQINATTLMVQSLDLTDDDLPNQPTLRYRYVITYNDISDRWQLESKKLLSKVKND